MNRFKQGKLEELLLFHDCLLFSLSLVRQASVPLF